MKKFLRKYKTASHKNVTCARLVHMNFSIIHNSCTKKTENPQKAQQAIMHKAHSGPVIWPKSQHQKGTEPDEYN